MTRQPVKSSQIASIGHEGTTLEIEFKAHDPKKPNTVYQFANVTAKQHAAILKAKSIGRWFGKEIRSNPKKHQTMRIK